MPAKIYTVNLEKEEQMLEALLTMIIGKFFKEKSFCPLV